jgi:hypothetical protein
MPARSASRCTRTGARGRPAGPVRRWCPCVGPAFPSFSRRVLPSDSRRTDCGPAKPSRRSRPARRPTLRAPRRPLVSWLRRRSPLRTLRWVQRPRLRRSRRSRFRALSFRRRLLLSPTVRRRRRQRVVPIHRRNRRRRGPTRRGHRLLLQRRGAENPLYSRKTRRSRRRRRSSRSPATARRWTRRRSAGLTTSVSCWRAARA